MRTLRRALASRLAILAWCVLADVVFPDHAATGVRRHDEDPGLILRPFTRWDAAHYLAIARDGYRQLHDVAFFPAFPWLVSMLAALLPLPPAQARVVAALATTNFAFALAALGVLAAAGEDVAHAFCYSPAGVFFSVPYAESLFAACHFWGLALLRRQKKWAATLALTAAAACKAHGVFGAIFLLDATPSALARTALVLAPAALHEAANRARFRATISTWPPPRSLYALVQGAYWDVGLGRYWRLKQIPNFLLAAPACFLVARAAAADIRRNPRLAAHALVNLGLLLAIAHVEIATRLLAASCLYFHSQLAAAPKLWLQPYLLFFLVAGTAAHVNYLPWT